MNDVSKKIGVSFAVENDAADAAGRLNTAVAERFGSQILLGPTGNSHPHVTIAMGEIDPGALSLVTKLVHEACRTIEPFAMSFGPAARETMTGRYVLADVALPTTVHLWRDALRTKIANHLAGLSRATDDPHLTLAVVEGHDDAVDQLLARTDLRIADCTVTHIDIAHAGPRGAKGDTIQRFELGSA